jgi:ribosome-binding protein aMBF1 (putative translation factor)
LSNVDSIDDSDNVKHNDGDDNSKHNDEIIMWKNELNAVLYIKKEHEDMLLQSKKYIEELKYEIEQLKEQHHQQVASGGTTISSSTTITSSNNDNNDNKNIIVIKELNQKLSITSIKLLQVKLKEKESNINKVEQEKNKLENYTKRSLIERYMNIKHISKDEKHKLQSIMIIPSIIPYIAKVVRKLSSIPSLLFNLLTLTACRFFLPLTLVVVVVVDVIVAVLQLL